MTITRYIDNHSNAHFHSLRLCRICFYYKTALILNWRCAAVVVCRTIVVCECFYQIFLGNIRIHRPWRLCHCCIVTSFPEEVRSIAIGVSVCLFVCLFSCTSQKPHVQASQKFTVHTCGHGSFFRLMTMQYTSSFMDDVVFSHNGTNADTGLESVA